MRRYTVLGVLALLVLLVSLGALLLSCGGGGGSGSGSSDASGTNAGTLSISVTDAKPELPDGVTKVLFTFGEVRVHTPGGGWRTLPLANGQKTYTIDLLFFSKPDNGPAELVPPVRLDPGKYTQLRFPVISASIVFDDGTEEPLEVPSDELKAVPEFTFEVHGGGAVNLVVDFVLSRNIVVTGSGKYMLKPVLHIVETEEAAEVKGSIPAAAFGSSTKPAIVTVWWDKDTSCSLDENVDEIYTSVTVPKAEPEADFDIFWLVPNEAYIVQIAVGGNTFLFPVPGSSGGVCGTLPPSAVFNLELATIQGTIPADAFGATTQATVTVYVDTNGNCSLDPSTDNEFTTVTVLKTNPVFSISVFPGESYILEIDVNGKTFLYPVPGLSGGTCQKLAPDAIFNLAPATIQGSIAATTFGASTQAIVTVTRDKNANGSVDAGDETYTQVTVPKPATGPAAFSISVFPQEAYIVLINVAPAFKGVVPADQLPVGGPPFPLNGGNPI